MSRDGAARSAPAASADPVAEPALSEREVRQALEEALASSAADHTEAWLESRELALTRFANNEIHQNVATRNHSLTVRAFIGRRSGRASVNRLDSTALRQAAERATTLARLSPEDPDLPAPGDPVAATPIEAFVSATAGSTPEQRAEAIGPLLETAAARTLNAAGALATTTSVLAYASTRGRRGHHAETRAQFTCTVRTEGASGWVDRHHRDIRALDPGTLGRIAIEKAERSRRPIALDPGPRTVVLEPSAVAELVGFLAFLGLGAQADQEGRSFMAGRIGRPVTGERVTLVDDARDPRAFGSPFDSEGTPRSTLALIERGVARAVVHDRRTAARAGIESTGHATPPPSVEGPLPYSLILRPGDTTIEEMIASTDRGVLVTRFWYNRVVDDRKTLITGMTRDGTFLIEEGRVTRALRNLRYNESVLDALARAEAIGRELEPTVFDWTGHCVVAPALKVRDFRFTGVSPS